MDELFERFGFLSRFSPFSVLQARKVENDISYNPFHLPFLTRLLIFLVCIASSILFFVLVCNLSIPLLIFLVSHFADSFVGETEDLYLLLLPV
jgi:hypothetical protein